MIGVDLTSISRFQKIPFRVVKRILHPQEITHFEKLEENLRAAFLAARWAIKEALFKADNQLFAFSKIHIKKINNRYFYKNYWISLSHERDLIVAITINKEKFCQP